MEASNQALEVFALALVFFFSSRRRPTRCIRDWSSDVCSSDLTGQRRVGNAAHTSGAVLGLLVGLAVVARGAARVGAVAAVAVGLVLAVVGGAAVTPSADELEIGRAACRGRGGVRVGGGCRRIV